MELLNLFSYVQYASMICNIDRGTKEGNEGFGEKLEGLSRNLDELVEAIEKSKNIGEKKKETLKSFENVKKVYENKRFEILKSLEIIHHPNRIFVEWDNFVGELSEILDPKTWLNSQSLNVVQNLAGKAKDLKQMFKKSYYIEYAAELAKKYARNAIGASSLVLNEIKNAYKELGYSFIYLEAQLVERGLFGASQSFGKLLFEIALEFDPYLNVPFIPGSSIKGAFRNTYENLRKPDWPATIEVFGSGAPEAEVGDLIFNDAYPIKPGFNEMILYPDILNPHYSKEGKDILGEYDWEPVPNPYLTVAPGTTFGFLIASKRNKLSFDKLNEVMKVVLEIGLGGKTCIGYGRFALNINVIERTWR